MAVSSVFNYQLLNAWQRWNTVSPWQFNQITGTGIDAPVSTPGEYIWIQPDRELVQEGISTAVALMIGSVPHTFHRPMYTHDHVLLDWRIPLSRQLTQLNYHHVQALGRRATTLITADAAVVYSDTNSDGVDDLATITVVTTFTEASEIQIFFRVADGAVSAASELWQIEPTRVTFSGGNAIIKAHRSLFVQPSLWNIPTNGPNWNSASKHYGSTTNAADFVTQVDVYRVYPDPAQAVTLAAYPFPDCDPSLPYDTFSGNIRLNDSRLGLVTLLPPTIPNCSHYYVYADVYYQAGIPLDSITGQPDPALERAVIRLANAEIPYVPPNMKSDSTARWVNDAKAYPAAEALTAWASNPFGARTGHIEAWRVMDMPQYSIGTGGRIRSR